FDPRHCLGTHCYGFPKTGPHWLWFLLQSMRDLRETLQTRGSTLVVRKGRPEDVVCDLITQLGSVTVVVFHEEVRE
ncbi:CRYD protein, partial [Nothocercus julius]|nr:CRYD protein [Nothocercus julius]